MTRIVELISFSFVLMIEKGTNDANGIQEFCQSEIFKAACWSNEVILIEYAYYGRMRLGKCVEADLGYIGCNASVLSLADRECSGKRTCQIPVPNEDLDKTAPCFKELKTYLEIKYKCVKVTTAQARMCGSSSYVKLMPYEGYISSHVAQETGCGKSKTPWVLNVKDGQKINITLIDFSVDRSLYSMTTKCHRYASIKEKTINKTTIICGGVYRVSHAYISKTNSIEISFLSQNSENFLLQYSTSGCSDIKERKNIWFLRIPGGAEMGCKTSSLTWRLLCKNNRWIGKHRDCAQGNKISETEKSMRKPMDISYGLSVMIIIGIALLLGLTILCIGLLCFAKRRKPFRRNVKVTGKPGCNDSYKLYEKAPCLYVDPMAASQGFAHHHHHPVNINGSEYSHIWETPLADTDCINFQSGGTYMSKCECIHSQPNDRTIKVSDEKTLTIPTYNLNPQEDMCSHKMIYDPRDVLIFDQSNTFSVCEDGQSHNPDILPSESIK